MNKTQTAGQAPAQKSGSKKYLLLLLLLLAALAAVLIWRAAGPKGEEPAFAPNAVVGAPGMTDQEIQDALSAKLDDKMISFSLNTEPVFENGSAEGRLLLVSNPSNSNNLQFIIRRDDTGETVYDSQMLSPNTYIEKDVLQTEEPLPAGEYPCTATILLLKAETYEQLGKVEAALTIIVQN